MAQLSQKIRRGAKCLPCASLRKLLRLVDKQLQSRCTKRKNNDIRKQQSIYTLHDKAI